ncbi:MAG: DegT/DnrJ/EryC1/StrS family aminotransferase [Methanomicrobiales archaeon]|nr:DegT/DnrJ/EryC1/StrS family aminotransferase [Methanomicrobiales archaeon]MDD1655157.1 DegT/DnrJ/EryC1/StrS family aminotransferase [Methanomicrobiales archaeon]
MAPKGSSGAQLAMFGGRPVRDHSFPPYPLLGEEEVQAVTAVVRSGKLSMFDLDFLGGEQVRGFEEEFARYHGSRYAISVNSGTAALHVAVAAAGIGPGDEVIVPPYTFTATASAVLMHNGVPAFADVTPDTFNLDPGRVEEAITGRTKALIPVHLFGHPAEMDALMEIARDHDLAVIEDCAQAPGAEYRGRKVGTIGHLSAFSFQRTKNMTTGEGGMILTDDPDLAHRCRLVRNHGEAFMAGQKREYLANILGWNYRMTEMEAAIGREQLKKLDAFNAVRRKNARFLSERLSRFRGITPPVEAPHVVHVYSIYALRYHAEMVGIPKSRFIAALEAEGIPVWGAYPRPLYENPLFRERIAYGARGCPFTCTLAGSGTATPADSCPVAEEHCRSVFGFTTIRPPSTPEDMQDIVEAFGKIMENLGEFGRETG